ncbi:MAG: haloacid dehalogenase-like hydrolase [Planctomycetaceae bacterium]
MRAICLFDIDGTLLSTGGAGQRAMEQALGLVFGITKITGEILAAGRTDRAITSDLFAQHGLVPTDAEWERFQTVYFDQLTSMLASLNGLVLPGVSQLLRALSQRDDVALGLLTGNFREGASRKLKHYGLDHYFAFGGYGDFHRDRDDVARTAWDAAVESLGEPPLTAARQGGRLFVIGDTPADVRCARAIGAQAVAVATGIYSHETLAETAPDQLYQNFQDPQPLIDSICR